MLLTLATVFIALTAAGVCYGILHRRLGWVDIWSPASGPALRPFVDQLPLDDIQNSLYLASDGALVGGWELQGIDPSLQAPDSVAAYLRRFNHALNALNPRYTEAVIQVVRSKDVTGLLLRFDQCSRPRTPERLFLKRRWRRQLLAMARSDAFPFLDTRLYLFLRVTPDQAGPRPLRVVLDLLRDATQLRRFDRDAEATALRVAHAGRVQFFAEHTRGCLQALSQTTFAPRRLSNAELEQHAKSLLWSADSMASGYAVARRPDPSRFLLSDADRSTRRRLAGVPSVAEYFPQTVRAQIASVEYSAYPDHVILDGRYVGVMRMFTPPGQVREDMMAGFRDALQFPCTYTVRIRPRQKQAELDRMRREAELKMVQANTRTPGSPIPDQANVSNAAEAQQRYLDATAPDRNPFAVDVILSFDAQSMTELKERAERIQSYFLTLADCRVVRERHGADRVFRETLPFAVPGNGPRMLLLTDEITCLAMLFSPWRGAAEPVRVFRTRSGEPWAYDPVDRTLVDRNMAHFGRTGSGKGVIGMAMTYGPALIKGDCDVLIIDSGGTYRRFARLLNGKYYEASAATEEAFNLLVVPPSYYALKADDRAEFLRAHLSTCVSAIITLAEPTTGSESVWTAIVSEVVTALVRDAVDLQREVLLHDVTAALLAYRNPELPERELEARRIAMNLRPYVHDVATGAAGRYARLFDRPQAFDLDTDCLVVDFNRIKTESPAVLTAYLILVISGVFVQRVMRNYGSGSGRYTRWLADEIVGYLPNPRFRAEFLRGYREHRKFRGGADAMLQSFNDLSLPHLKDFGTPMKEASTTKVFLAHTRNEQAAAAFASDGLGLLGEKVFELESEIGVFSEAIVQQGADRFADVIVAPDSFELWVETTNPEDTATETAYTDHYGPLSAWHLSPFEVTYLLSALWPHGVAHPPTIPGCSRDRFPADDVVRRIVDEVRIELTDCRRELDLAGARQINAADEGMSVSSGFAQRTAWTEDANASSALIGVDG